MDLLVDNEEAAALRAASRDWPSWDLTQRQTCDLELLLTGGFSPLRGFMTRAAYQSVCSDMRLPGGTLWPMPIVLDVPETIAQQLTPGQPLSLRDVEGVMLAVLDVEEVWRPNRTSEAQAVFGTADVAHPGVAHLLRHTHPWYVGGRLRGVHLPTHYDFRALRLTPANVRATFAARGWDRVVGFNTRNPMHRAHHELTLRAARDHDAKLLIHPVVGMTKPGDVDHYTRVRCYQAMLGHYPADTAMLALLPLAMRMGGPREALWHAIIRKNHGCSHFIVGRDHAGPGRDSRGSPFYGRYDSQELVQRYANELGLTVVPFRTMMYVQELGRYVGEDEVPPGSTAVTISGTELRERIAQGRDIPEWFTFTDVVERLRESHPERSRQGITIFLTGLSGAGKSTIANVLLAKLLERGGRQVTLLDGDVVRKVLSPDLGFAKADRDANIRRIGFVAGEITKNGGIVICAAIAPYDAVRREMRHLIERHGRFLLVHVHAPLEVCEERDRKGLYARARAGLVKDFTGISDPYESPEDADLLVDTTQVSAEAAADLILKHLRDEAGLEGTR